MGGAWCVFWDPRKGHNRYVSKEQDTDWRQTWGIDYVNCKDFEKAQI